MRTFKRSLGVLTAAALVLAGLGAWPASASVRPASRATAPAQPAQPAPRTKSAWQKDIAHVRQPGRGCFNASYPALAWHAVKCVSGPRYPLAPAPPSGSARHARPATVGGSSNPDYLTTVTGLITQATGSFQSVSSGIKEHGQINGTGSQVTNAFSLQLNSQYFSGSPACAGAANAATCQAWQQFLYTYGNATNSTIYMQYWLLHYDAACPSGWAKYLIPKSTEWDCFVNDPQGMARVATLTASGLASAQLSGTAAWGRE